MRSGLVAASLVLLVACDDGKPPGADSSFAALQERGKDAMGVDQYASAHSFEPLADGGRIVLQMKVSDPIGQSAIRRHMSEIAAAFRRGDFTIPGRVHAVRVVPGTDVMARRRDEISFTPGQVDRGGELRLTTRNPEAVRAIHEFLAFQRREHRAGMH